jgi:hypothetical protein
VNAAGPASPLKGGAGQRLFGVKGDRALCRATGRRRLAGLLRARLIQEARAIYERIFPTEGPASDGRRREPGFPETSMPLFISQNQNVRGIRWRGIAATVVVELLVLLALGAAVVRYVEWSSDAALAEFMSATKLSASDLNHSGEISTPIQALKGRPACDRVELLTPPGSAAGLHSRNSYSNATPSG